MKKQTTVKLRGAKIIDDVVKAVNSGEVFTHLVSSWAPYFDERVKDTPEKVTLESFQFSAIFNERIAMIKTKRDCYELVKHPTLNKFMGECNGVKVHLSMKKDALSFHEGQGYGDIDAKLIFWA